MQKEQETFVQDATDAADPLFALRLQDLSQIQPNYHQTQDIGQGSAQTRTGSGRQKRKQTLISDQIDLGGVGGLGRRQKSELSIPRLPASGFPAEFPFNKDGYRYVLAEADPHGPFRREFEESQVNQMIVIVMYHAHFILLRIWRENRFPDGFAED